MVGGDQAEEARETGPLGMEQDHQPGDERAGDEKAGCHDGTGGDEIDRGQDGIPADADELQEGLGIRPEQDRKAIQQVNHGLAGLPERSETERQGGVHRPGADDCLEAIEQGGGGTGEDTEDQSAIAGNQRSDGFDQMGAFGGPIEGYPPE